ncbi:MAG: hypothetical protein ACLFQV_08250 [Vulcanimicrobiota bacterium]
MDSNNKISQLKSLAIKKRVAGSQSTLPGTAQATRKEVVPSQEKQPQTLEEALEEIESRVVKIRHFKTGKIDDFGRVVGVKEYQPGRVPHFHQDHMYDEKDRVIMLKMYEKEFSKPYTRIYFYEGDSDKIHEAVWFNRYGKLDNIHRYAYDMSTGLLVHRAEYNREGEIFYQIFSEFEDTDPPRNTQEVWKDKTGNLIQRFVYKYDEAGDIVIEERYDNNDNFIGEFHFTYDDKRVNLMKKEWFGPDKTLRSYFVYEHDANDNTTKCVLMNPGGTKESTQLFVYDEIGELKEEKWMDEKDKVFKHVKY